MTNNSARAHPERALRLAPRRAPLVLLAALAFQTGGGRVHATADREVRLLTIDGVINPLTVRYLTRELWEAAEARSELVVVRLDTPGGLESSMRRMTEAILSSPVPVAVYVAPSGARAASAGMFLTIAAHVAAMAPGTNIGAAHPVGLGKQVDTVMAEKVVNDAAALARAIAAAHARNAVWAEQAVRLSVSITAHEALSQDVIDVVTGDLAELLRRIDGRRLTTAAGPVTLRTAGARVVESPMRRSERILHALADPNVAYLLFTIGTVGLIAKLYNPGMIFPGLTGLISLILYVPLGVPSPALPRVRVSPWLVAGMTAGMATFLSEIWSALADDGVIRSGEAVEVVGVEGVTLRVRRPWPL